ALLLPPAADHCAARTAARHTLILIAPVESSDPLAADVGLKARRALGEAIGHLLVATDAERDAADLLADEAGEAMDGGLALVRHWESHGVTQHRELAARLYRLGAQLYLAHQPHFLAEFLLENLDSALK